MTRGSWSSTPAETIPRRLYFDKETALVVAQGDAQHDAPRQVWYPQTDYEDYAATSAA